MTAIAMLGSGEFLPWSTPVDEWCLSTSSVGGDRVLVVPTACAPEGHDVFARWATMGVTHYERMGLRPEVLELRTRDDAEDRRIASAVDGARLIFFSGGNPGYLAETLRDTATWRAITDAIASGVALGGCSAGAVFLGTIAPFVDGTKLERWVDGVRLLDDSYVVAHFDALDGYVPGLRARLLDRAPDGDVIVGLDEDTALCGDGTDWHVRGRGGVWVGRDASSLTEYRAGDTAAVPVTLAVP